MINGFPQGRSLFAKEIAIDLQPQSSQLNLLWVRGDLLRELPRFFWMTVAWIFVVVGATCIPELWGKCAFIFMGLTAFMLLCTSVSISITNGKSLERKQSLWRIHLGSEKRPIPPGSVFSIHRVKESEGYSSCLVLTDGVSVIEVLPVLHYDDYGELCRKLNIALNSSKYNVYS
jgi:hypothetical protein